eukprot:gb/GFBE01006547.1/.p1 GENE.gb/GFBE01006547.1/~~gb/GFBE01006547.1/.p1  ORF type:complete len:620 (+),score=119.38 gb/GFBE01006547.1/:1-1860(+)
MEGTLPSLIDGAAEPVKHQVQGLLKFADALHAAERKRSKRRVLGPGKRVARRPLPGCSTTSLSLDFPSQSEQQERQTSEKTQEEESSPRSDSLTGKGDWNRLKDESKLPRSITACLNVYADDEEDLGSKEVRDSLTSIYDSASSELEGTFNKTKVPPLPTLRSSLTSRGGKSKTGALTARERRRNSNSEEYLMVYEARCVVEVYQQRKKAAEFTVQESMERFRKGRKAQEPLLEDLRQLKKAFAEPPKPAPKPKFDEFRDQYKRTTLAAANQDPLQASQGESEDKVENKVESEAPGGLTRMVSGGSAVSTDTTGEDKRKSTNSRPEPGSLPLPRSVVSGNLTPRSSFASSVGSMPVPSSKSERFRSSSKTSVGMRLSMSQVPELSPEEEYNSLMKSAQEIEQQELEQLARWEKTMRQGPSRKEDGGDWLQDPRSHHASQTSLTSNLSAPRHRSERGASARAAAVESSGCSRLDSACLQEEKCPDGTEHVFIVSFSKTQVPAAAADASQDTAAPAGAAAERTSTVTSVLSAVTPPESPDLAARRLNVCRLAKSCQRTTIKKPWEKLFDEKESKERGKQGMPSVLKLGKSSSWEKDSEASAVSAWANIRKTQAFSVLCGQE